MSTIVTLYSKEEHIGKTTFGINLGVSLIQETQQPVLLVDLNSQGDGFSANSILRISPAHPLTASSLSAEQIDVHVQRHSSQLAVLTIDADVIRDETIARSFMHTFFLHMQNRYAYILIDASTQPHRITYEAIDHSSLVIFFSTSSEHEYPVEILGKQLRHVVRQKTGGSGRVSLHKQGCYYLPKDTLTLDTFRGTGIPFVIQAPYRPISQVVARLARDIGNRRLGIALIGGAALGLAQLGMLEVFERNRIEIDMIVGTGFGAFIGANYALGVELSRLTRYLVSWAMKQTYPFRVHSFIFRGRLLKGIRLQSLFENFLQDVYFEELQIPLCVTAFNARAGHGIIFREGKVLDAIVSSMRIPGLFVPFKHTERYLVDNSMVLSTLLSPLRQMGAHILVAVQVPLLSQESGRAFAQAQRRWWQLKRYNVQQNQAIMAATFDNLMHEMKEVQAPSLSSQRIEPDIMVTPDVKGVSWRNFHKINELIEAGARAAEAAIPKFEDLTY